MTGAELAGRLIEAARRAGADAADALVVSSRDVSVSVRGGALEEAESAESLDYGLRALVGRRQACVSASDPSDAALEEVAARAVAMARAAPEDPHCGLPDGGLADLSLLPDLDIEDRSEPPLPVMLKTMAAEAEAAALAVAGVSQAESAGAGWRRSDIAYAATNGFSGGYARTGASLSVSAVAGQGLGMETDYEYASRTHFADLPPPAEIGETAGARAAARLSPRRAKTGAYPVLFDRRVSGTLVGHVLGAINGSAVARGASWLKDRMGERILPPGFTITDDPHRPRASGSRPFDGEGMALSARKLVDDGVLAGWTLDSATARRLGLPAPGGARRGVGGPPSPGTSTLELSEGEETAEALIRAMGEGLIVTSLIGSSISATTGAYSRGAAGFWVEGGEIAWPVNELTIAGSLPDFLLRMRAANDADRTRGVIAPSLLVEGLTIASG